VNAERRGDAHAHLGVACARLARELRHVDPRVTAGREEVRHHHHLAGAGRDARVDRLGHTRARERQVRRRDAPTGQALRERGRDGGERAVRADLAAAVIDEEHGAPGSAPRRHQ
jgi:hypothetical protein